MTIRHTCGCTAQRGCPLGALLFRTGRDIAWASHLEETATTKPLPKAARAAAVRALYEGGAILNHGPHSDGDPS